MLDVSVIAVGDGSALNIGKLSRIMAVQDASPVEIVRGQGNIHRRGITVLNS